MYEIIDHSFLIASALFTRNPNPQKLLYLSPSTILWRVICPNILYMGLSFCLFQEEFFEPGSEVAFPTPLRSHHTFCTCAQYIGDKVF